MLGFFMRVFTEDLIYQEPYSISRLEKVLFRQCIAENFCLKTLNILGFTYCFYCIHLDCVIGKGNKNYCMQCFISRSYWYSINFAFVRVCYKRRYHAYFLNNVEQLN